MNKREKYYIIFVCSGICDLTGELISKDIKADSVDDAARLFLNCYSVHAKTILGPFEKKYIVQAQHAPKILNFANQPMKRAIYQNWLVNSFLLSEPQDHAYLVFIKRMDDKKTSSPKGIITVPISELRYI